MTPCFHATSSYVSRHVQKCALKWHVSGHAGLPLTMQEFSGLLVGPEAVAGPAEGLGGQGEE